MPVWLVDQLLPLDEFDEWVAYGEIEAERYEEARRRAESEAKR